MSIFNAAQHYHREVTNGWVIPALVKSPFRGYRVGDLSVYVSRLMRERARSFASLFPESYLVNVKSWYTGFSHGVVDPTDAPHNRHLVFTFSFRWDVKDFPDPKRLVRRVLANNIVVYGTKEEAALFISVGLTATDLAKFDVSNIQARALRYLYAGVGTIHNALLAREPYDKFTREQRDKSARRALRTVEARRLAPATAVLNSPYWSWPFRVQAWRSFPNLMCQDQMEQHAALAWARWFQGENVDVYGYGYDLLWGTGRHTQSIFNEVRASLLAYLQAVNSQDKVLHRPGDALFPGMLYSLLYDNKRGLPADLETAYAVMVGSFNERGAELGDLFSPVEDTVTAIMEADPHFVSRVSFALDNPK